MRINKHQFTILGVSLLAITLIAGLTLSPAFAEPKSKIVLCHQGDLGHETISVSGNAKDAHLAHDDTLGACGDVTDPPTPTLLAPVDNAVIDLSVDPVFVFSWSEVPDPSGVSYTLRILGSESQTVFEGVINQDTDTNKDQPGIQFLGGIDQDTNTDQPGIYSWSVFAIDGAGNESPFATPFSFTLIP